MNPNGFNLNLFETLQAHVKKMYTQTKRKLDMETLKKVKSELDAAKSADIANLAVLTDEKRVENGLKQMSIRNYTFLAIFLLVVLIGMTYFNH